MLKHTRDTAVLAGLVYFTQGMLGLTGIALPLFMRGLKWSIADITTISSIVAFPWVLKIIYGLLSDCFPILGYRRKTYLMLCAVLSSLGWCCLAILPPDKSWIIGSLILTNLGFAATDVITDGLIVEHSRGFTSHVYQSIAWGSRSVGAIIGGFLGGWLAAHWAPKNVFFLASTLPVLSFIFAFHIYEIKRERAPFKSVWEPFSRCLRVLSLPNLRWFMFLLVVITVSSSFAVPFFFHMKESLGFQETFLGTLASLGWFGAVLGSLIYAKWLSKISPKVILRWALIINSLNTLSTLLILGQKSAFILVFVGGFMGCITILPIMSVAALFAHHSEVEGSIFAILMSIFNLGQIMFGFFGGKLYTYIGLQPLIWIAGIIGFSGLLICEKLRFETGPSSSHPESLSP